MYIKDMVGFIISTRNQRQRMFYLCIAQDLLKLLERKEVILLPCLCFQKHVTYTKRLKDGLQVPEVAQKARTKRSKLLVGY